MKDLLGNEVTIEEARALKKRREPTPNGYAWAPGTGPAGETCGSCVSLHRNELAKTYLKCERNRAKWTGGRKSDILARSPACKFWERAPVPEKPPAPRKTKRPAPLPPPTLPEREKARKAAAALRAALADPFARGESSTMHADLSRPRRGVWITTWSNLPGFVREQCSRSGLSYSHECLPGWSYQRSEIRSEMIPDLEALAERGERPTTATTPAPGQGRSA